MVMSGVTSILACRRRTRGCRRPSIGPIQSFDWTASTIAHSRCRRARLSCRRVKLSVGQLRAHRDPRHWRNCCGPAVVARAVSLESLRANPDGKAEREFRYGLWEANTKSFKNAPKHFEKAPADRRATHLQRQPIGRRLNFNATIINAPLARARRQSSGARPEDRRGRGCVDKGRR